MFCIFRSHWPTVVFFLDSGRSLDLKPETCYQFVLCFSDFLLCSLRFLDTEHLAIFAEVSVPEVEGYLLKYFE